MLEYLHVKNLALLEECELDFSKGLNVFTGETGAGKSVLLGSVNLALGAHADREMIRTGCDEAYVELGFSLSPSVKAALDSLDLPCEEDSVFISRRITPTKNIFKINGETVPARMIKELASGLIDIHGQHEHQSLLQVSRQMDMLDAFGGENIKQLLEETKTAAGEYLSLKSELDELSLKDKDRNREISLLRFEVEEIEKASLKVGEDDDLEDCYKKMQASEKLLSLTTEALSFISGDRGEDAGSFVSRAIQNLRRISQIDESKAELEEKLLQAESLLGDVAFGLSDYMDELDFSEEEFNRVEERLNTINSLKARFGSTIEKVLAYYEEKLQELEKLEHLEEYIAELAKKVDKALAIYDKKAGALSEARKKCADEFSKLLTDELTSLSFSYVNFIIDHQIKEDVISPKGRDAIEFMISTNIGEPVRPMKNVASGGELSRIMLAIKTILAYKDEIDALIFDEIDTGISGKTAWEVAGKLARLSKEHQVILITHLAQIASMADVHYEIKKNDDGGRTFTTITKLSEEGEISELARLLGADTPDEATIENAKELKRKANERKAES